MTTEHYEIQSKHFDKMSHSTKNDHINDEASRAELEIFLKFLNIKDLSNLKILEVGSGTGRYTIHLLDKNAKVTATEISKESLNEIQKQAKKINKEQNLICVHDPLEDPLFNNEFDVVFCVNLLHHVEDMQNVFKNMYKASKPGGIVAIIEPNPFNPLFYIDFFRKRNWNIEKGILRCTRGNLKALFLRNNLIDLHIKRYILIPNFISNKLNILKPLNQMLLCLPLINEFYMFHMMYARKQS